MQQKVVTFSSFMQSDVPLESWFSRLFLQLFLYNRLCALFIYYNHNKSNNILKAYNNLFLATNAISIIKRVCTIDFASSLLLLRAFHNCFTITSVATIVFFLFIYENITFSKGPTLIFIKGIPYSKSLGGYFLRLHLDLERISATLKVRSVLILQTIVHVSIRLSQALPSPLLSSPSLLFFSSYLLTFWGVISCSYIIYSL